MKKIVLGCFVTGAMAIAACSSSSDDACNTLINAAEKLDTLQAPCAVATDGGTVDAGTTGQTVAACESAYSGSTCTSTDRATITTLADNYNTCVNALAACTTATESTFQANTGACFTIIAEPTGDAGLSSSCAASLSNALNL